MNVGIWKINCKSIWSAGKPLQARSQEGVRGVPGPPQAIQGIVNTVFCYTMGLTFYFSEFNH